MCDCANCKAGGYTYSVEYMEASKLKYVERRAAEIAAIPMREERQKALLELRGQTKPTDKGGWLYKAVSERAEQLYKGKRRGGSLAS